MRNIAIAVVATTMLGACGFMTPAKQYAGDTQSVSGFATVKGHTGIPFSGEFHATITGFTKLESLGSGEQKTFGIAGFTDYPKEIQVLAGEYSVHVYCFRGLASYRPSTTQSLEAGKTYLLKCDMRDGQAIVNVHATAS